MAEEYGFKGYVQSDCGAVNNEFNGSETRGGGTTGGENWATSKEDAAAKALVNGMMNSNCGGGLVGHICSAIDKGMASMDDLTARVNRSMTLLMAAGLFDPVEGQSYTKIPFDTINSDEAVANNLEASRQGLVLLQNPGNILPLTNPSTKQADTATTTVVPTIALIGPHSRTQKTLAGNYFEGIGLGTCSGATCIPTIEASLKTAMAKASGGNASVTTVEACRYSIHYTLSLYRYSTLYTLTIHSHYTLCCSSHGGMMRCAKANIAAAVAAAKGAIMALI
jgi:beta-glucosidase-like glycosyl hydrolase